MTLLLEQLIKMEKVILTHLRVIFCFGRKYIHSNVPCRTLFAIPNDAVEKASRLNEVPNRITNMIPKVQDELVYINTVSATSEPNDGSKPSTLQPPPHSLSSIPGAKVIANPAVTTKGTERQAMASSIKMYTVASLQQYTNSFSDENRIGEGTLGSVYRAELPDGKVVFFRFNCSLFIYNLCSTDTLD